MIGRNANGLIHLDAAENEKPIFALPVTFQDADQLSRFIHDLFAKVIFQFRSSFDPHVIGGGLILILDQAEGAFFFHRACAWALLLLGFIVSVLVMP